MDLKDFEGQNYAKYIHGEIQWELKARLKLRWLLGESSHGG